MKLYSIEGNRQRLDGGSMFGNCPKTMWETWCPPDEKNRISLACRGLLVREPSGRNVLLEAGIGSFFHPKLRERYGVEETESVLLGSLAAVGLTPDDVHVVVLSHLHFDHAGGLLAPFEEGKPHRLAFGKASFVVSKGAWERAKHPHARDKASFIPELQELMEATGRVEVVSGDRSTTLGDAYSFSFSEGHTPGLMLTRVEGGERPVTFLGDLVPGTPWVHLPITMGYDRFPELLIEEKERVLARILAEDGLAFYTHDPKVVASRLTKGEKGKYMPLEPLARLAG
ncbi:MAG: MBL fold metallo-hydrolase [Polyangiaceae bacterium]